MSFNYKFLLSILLYRVKKHIIIKMPTKAELTKYIKAYKKKNCPPYSKLKKAELQKVAKEMGYGQEKEREAKVSGGNVLQRIKEMREASKSRMLKRAEKDSTKSGVPIIKFFGKEKTARPKTAQPKTSQPKKSKEELMNELKKRRTELLKEFVENGDKMRGLSEYDGEGRLLLKRNTQIQADLKKITDAYKKIKAR